MLNVKLCSTAHEWQSETTPFTFDRTDLPRPSLVSSCDMICELCELCEPKSFPQWLN